MFEQRTIVWLRLEGLDYVLIGVQQPWSPSGGWWHTPKNYRANLVYISLGMFALSVVGWRFNDTIKVTSNREVDDDTIERWNKAARKSREAAAVTKAAGGDS